MQSAALFVIAPTLSLPLNPDHCLGVTRQSERQEAMSKNAAYYRGYKIEGAKERQGWLLRVSPVKPELPILRRADFRVTEKTWPQAVSEAVAKIDVLRNK
jgi:hypothetical protein